MSLKFRKELSVFPLIFILIGGCASPRPAGPDGTKLKEDPTFRIVVPRAQEIKLSRNLTAHRFQLENGLTLLVSEDISSPTLHYMTWYNFGTNTLSPKGPVPGAKMSPPTQEVVRIFEYLLSNPARHLRENEFQHRLSRVGAINFSTHFNPDTTRISFEIPREKLPLAAKLESDRMMDLRMDAVSIRGAALRTQESMVRRSIEDVDSPLEIWLQKLVFEPERTPEQSVAKAIPFSEVDVEEVKRFYTEYFNPAHATIVLVGDITPERAYQIVAYHYGDLPSQAKVNPSVKPAPMPSASPHGGVSESTIPRPPKSATVPLEIQSGRLWIAYPLPSHSLDTLASAEFFARLLSGGPSSRLQRALLETGIARDVATEVKVLRKQSLFIIKVKLLKGRRPDEAEREIQTVIDRLQRETVSEQELDRTKRRVRLDAALQVRSRDLRGNLLGFYESVFSRPAFWSELQEEIEDLSQKDLLRASQSFFDEKGKTVLRGVSK